MTGFVDYSSKVTQRKLMAVAIWLLAAGCAPSPILLVNPETREVMRCSAARSAARMSEMQMAVERCAKQFESVGYIRFKNLTKDQKASLGGN